MTNLLEKALIIGFGIFILTIFISIINPFIVQVSDLNENINPNIEKYENLFSELDTGIKFTIENPNATCKKLVEYPENLNISLTGFYCKYEYVVGTSFNYKIVEYSKPFIEHSYHNLPTNSYYLEISIIYGFIEIQFK